MPEHLVKRTGSACGIEGLFTWHTRSSRLSPLPLWDSFEAEGVVWTLTPWPFPESLWLQSYRFTALKQEELIVEVKESRQFDGFVVWNDRRWRIMSLGAYATLTDDQGAEIARFSEAWKDSDLAMGATHRVTLHDDAPLTLVALSFGVCLGVLTSFSQDG